MPRVTQAWKSNPERSRYYRLRADRLEQQNAEARAQYVQAGTIGKDLAAFCNALQARIDRSALATATKSELAEDISDFVSKSVNGQNGKAARNPNRRHRAKAA
jgi:hypothetical protein